MRQIGKFQAVVALSRVCSRIRSATGVAPLALARAYGNAVPASWQQVLDRCSSRRKGGRGRQVAGWQAGLCSGRHATGGPNDNGQQKQGTDKFAKSPKIEYLGTRGSCYISLSCLSLLLLFAMTGCNPKHFNVQDSPLCCSLSLFLSGCMHRQRGS